MRPLRLPIAVAALVAALPFAVAPSARAATADAAATRGTLTSIGGTFAAVVAACWVVLCLAAGDLQAAVFHRASTCAKATAASVAVAPPAGTTAGDLLLMVAVQEGSDSDPATPSGWTILPSSAYAADTDNRSVVFYRRATASEPSSWTVTASGGNALAVTVDAFSGVHATSPFAATVSKSNGTSTSLTLPTATATANGSMRWSGLGHWPAFGQTGRTVQYSAGLTETCDEQADGSFGQVVGASAAHESTGTGAVATRTATFSGTVERWSAWTLALSPAPVTCGSGGLSLTPPSSISFGSSQIPQSADLVLPGSTSLEVNDQTGPGSGWNLSATSTPLTNGSRSLPAGSVSVTGATSAARPGNCSTPNNSVSYPVAVPAGSPAPAGAKLFNAASGSGLGPARVDLQLALRVPTNAYAGTYTSTWTLTLAASP